MAEYDLAVLLPARNEMWLSRTVEDLLKNKRGKTQIILGCDGDWPDPPIVDHPDVVMLHYSESIGQRAITKQCAGLARAKYVAKTDSHCAFDEGFDVKLLDAYGVVGDDVTMAPAMRNLHCFNWVCEEGHTRYQGPSGPCTECGKETTRDVVWIAKTNPLSTAYCFDTEPHFCYDNGRKNTEDYKRGTIIGYKLWIDPRFTAPDLLAQVVPFSLGGSQPPSFTSIISLLTDFTSSHQFPRSTNLSGRGENVPIDAVCFPSVDDGRGIRTSEVLSVGDKFEVEGVATPPILAEVIKDGNISTPSSGNTLNEPSIEETMHSFALSEVGAVTITAFVDSSSPVPTTSKRINSNLIDELNGLLGGEFIYSEKTGSFHNGSVALDPVYDKGLTESMSLQGSFFMMTKERYFDLDMDDESFGSWGSQGIEVACKTWFSGGRVMINHKTWYAHMFRTQGGDFSFPYENPGRKVEAAKKRAKSVFFGPKLADLVERFMPVADWTQADIDRLRGKPSKGILYYTDNQLNMRLAKECRGYIKAAGLPITSVSLKPMTDMGTNIHLPLKRGRLTMVKQILAGLEAMTEDIVFMAEHDIFYHKSHFDFTPPDENTFYYNENNWRVRLEDGHAVYFDHDSLSQMCAYRELLVKEYRGIVERAEAGKFGSHEPGTRDGRSARWRSEYANLDVRHSNNFTRSRWSPSEFRDKSTCTNWTESTLDLIPGWRVPFLVVDVDTKGGFGQ